MAASTNTRFSCPACSKSYRWKPEIAGRKVKCTCGHVMVAPRAPVAEGEEELIPLADEGQAAHTVHGHQVMAGTTMGAPAIQMPPSPKPRGAPKNGICPACNAKLRDGDVVCVECGMHLGKGKKIESEGGQKVAAGASKSAAGVPATVGAKVVHVNRGQMLGRHFKHDEPAPRSKTPMFIGIAVLVALAAVAAFYFLRDKSG